MITSFRLITTSRFWFITSTVENNEPYLNTLAGQISVAIECSVQSGGRPGQSELKRRTY